MDGYESTPYGGVTAPRSVQEKLRTVAPRCDHDCCSIIKMLVGALFAVLAIALTVVAFALPMVQLIVPGVLLFIVAIVLIAHSHFRGNMALSTTYYSTPGRACGTGLYDRLPNSTIVFDRAEPGVRPTAGYGQPAQQVLRPPHQGGGVPGVVTVQPYDRVAGTPARRIPGTSASNVVQFRDYQ